MTGYQTEYGEGCARDSKEGSVVGGHLKCIGLAVVVSSSKFELRE